MIKVYIFDYDEGIDGVLREERPIDKTLRPTAERYVALDDLKPHIQYILDHEYYDMEYDSHLQELFSLLES